MNAAQRRKFIRSEENNIDRRHNMLLEMGTRWLMSRCLMCSATFTMSSLPDAVERYSHCESPHWDEWLAGLGDKQFSLLFTYQPEGTPDWFSKSLEKEATRRAEQELLIRHGVKDEN